MHRSILVTSRSRGIGKPPLPTTPQYTEDKKSQMAAMRSEMAMFESSGKRGRGLELAKTWHADILAKYLGWPSSVDAERAFSVAGVLCTKVH